MHIIQTNKISITIIINENKCKYFDFSFNNDDKSCEYLNKIIQKLDVITHNDHHKNFSNIEQLRFPDVKSLKYKGA